MRTFFPDADITGLAADLATAEGVAAVSVRTTDAGKRENARLLARARGKSGLDARLTHQILPTL